MKRFAWLLTALGLLFAQVSPVPTASRIPTASMDCCPSTESCANHSQPPKARDCSACLPCGPTCILAVLTSPLTAATVFTPQARVHLHDESAVTRRDPPPLPPPRLA
jgi:hypothetical protein